ncbi:glycoside hydrolase family 16 protein [Dyadobacter flavalbus]|uniref:Glycoside hydrolase family 16 protein n=1 Tax=Dyadobacter flavalbus TaxID=2579942 RepID=A0A5M8Q780_9BACT|nr:glycoside hydrolase family 16 protein [Dyadobacter flavalbus]KAA6430482.1 glycoside hydrolase family 16 protein [Dyadobacter flavalbus]
MPRTAPFFGSFLYVFFIAFSGCSQNMPAAPQYTFATTPSWQDEFDYSGKPDPAKWSYNLGDHGWGNKELEDYTDKTENARVENGQLVIEALKEKSGKADYSSARLVSKGKGDFLYGKFEIKARLPKGRGTWPAIWMLASENNYGNKGWPDNGEIDIMEHVGFDQNRVHGNIHTKAFNHSIGTNKGNNIMVENASEAFHIYAWEWTPDYISILADGKEYFRFTKENAYQWQEWPFDKPFHIILNIAVGGSWGGQKGVDDSIFPQKMEVDYVRVYPLVQKK